MPATAIPRATLNVCGYDSPNYAVAAPQVPADLDRRIDAVLQATGADKVELSGHSPGTSVSMAYLSSEEDRRLGAVQGQVRRLL